MNRTRKAEEVDGLRDRFDRMVNAVITDYRGLDVAAMTELRRRFRQANVEYKVVKNTLVKRAVAERPFADELGEHLHEMTAIAWSYEDPSASAKVIRDFIKENKKLKVKCGVMGEKVSSTEGWADIPSREQLLAMITGQLIGAPQGIMHQMISPAQKLVGLIDAWKDKLEEDQGATE